MNTIAKTLWAAVLTTGMAASAMAATPTAPINTAKDQQRAAHQAQKQAQQAALFQQADANRDGKLSAAEFTRFHELKKAAWQAQQQEREKNRFARLDANKDGGISQDELKAAHAQRAAFKHQHHGSHAQKPVL